MTNNKEFIAFCKARHGEDWKGKMADETGWSWWTFHRIEKGAKISRKLEKAVASLKARKQQRRKESTS